MKRRRLGSTDLLVSPVGLGTVKLGRNTGVRYPEPFAIPDDAQVRELLATACALGINLLDTAPAYGDSEARLGRLIEQRDDWLLCTKVGEEFDGQTSRFDFSPAPIRASVERSLRRLATDHLDIVLVHSSGDDVGIIERDGALDTLAALKREGKLRAFGMSTKTVEGGLLAATRSDCLMVTYNRDHTSEAPVLDRCAEHNSGVLVKKALASGQLGGAAEVADGIGFALGHPAVSSVVIGTIDCAHLRANVEAAERALGEG